MQTTYVQKLSFIPKQWASENWAKAHLDAVSHPRPGFERTLITLLTGWLHYADVHQGQYASGIGSDGVLGESWAQLGAAMRGLLNGSLGRLDGGTLDGLLADTLREQGFDPDRL